MWTDTLKSHFEHKTRKSQIILKECPFCQNSNYNIEFSIELKLWHCWICHSSGTVYKFFLLNNLPIDDDKWKFTNKRVKAQESGLVLDGYEYINYDEYKRFFISKGIEKKDIEKYRFMYSSIGKYKNKLVVPLYEGSKLVYFIARDLTTKGRYYNIERIKTNILPYYLGEKNRYWLYLCEGIFDAISINKLGYSSGILLGTNLAKEQILKIKNFGFAGVVINLDGDAKKKAFELSEKILKFSLVSTLILYEDTEEPNSLYVKDKSMLDKMLKEPKPANLVDKVKVMMKL